MADVQVVSKGSSIPVATKEGKAIAKVYLGMGWKINAQKSTENTQDYDLDFSLAALKADGKIGDDKHLVYYDENHLQFKDANGAVVIQHSADNLTGSTGSNDDEWGTIDLSKVPADVTKIDVFVNIYDAAGRNQKFGDVDSAYFKMVDADTNVEIARYELEKEFGDFTGVIVANFVRMGAIWNLQIVGKGVNGSIAEILKSEGME